MTVVLSVGNRCGNPLARSAQARYGVGVGINNINEGTVPMSAPTPAQVAKDAVLRGEWRPTRNYVGTRSISEDQVERLIADVVKTDRAAGKAARAKRFPNARRTAISTVVAELDAICEANDWAGRDGDALFFLETLLTYAADPTLTLVEAAERTFRGE